MTLARVAATLFTGFAVCFIGTGCGPNSAPAEISPAPAEGRTVLVDYAVPAAPATPQNLLKNASFEEVDNEGRPNDWIVWPPSVVVHNPASDYEPRDGASSVLIQSVDDEYAALNQYLDLPAREPVALWVSAQGRAPIVLAMYLSLECKISGENRVLGKQLWPACPDRWTPVAFEAEVPADAEPGSVRVRIVCVNRAGYLFRVDDVRVFRR